MKRTYPLSLRVSKRVLIRWRALAFELGLTKEELVEWLLDHSTPGKRVNYGCFDHQQ